MRWIYKCVRAREYVGEYDGRLSECLWMKRAVCYPRSRFASTDSGQTAAAVMRDIGGAAARNHVFGRECE